MGAAAQRQSVLVRKLWPWEWDDLRAHLLRLGPEDRRMRFCRPVNDATIEAYGDRIDRPRTTVVGCVDETYLTSSEGQIGLDWPTYLSLVEEMAADGQALIGAVFELPLKAAPSSEDGGQPGVHEVSAAFKKMHAWRGCHSG